MHAINKKESFVTGWTIRLLFAQPHVHAGFVEY